MLHRSRNEDVPQIWQWNKGIHLPFCLNCSFVKNCISTFLSLKLIKSKQKRNLHVMSWHSRNVSLLFRAVNRRQRIFIYPHEKYLFKLSWSGFYDPPPWSHHACRWSVPDKTATELNRWGSLSKYSSILKHYRAATLTYQFPSFSPRSFRRSGHLQFVSVYV